MRILRFMRQFSRRAFARLIDLCVVLAPSGLYYFVSRFLEFPVKIHSLVFRVRPELVTMFMSADFPGVFLTLLPPATGLARLHFKDAGSRKRDHFFSTLACVLQLNSSGDA